MDAVGPRSESRLLIKDPSTGIEFLVDSGAEVSLVPRTWESHADPKVVLTAANGSTISTFGSKLLEVSLNLRRNFVYPFIVADISHAILGADFFELVYSERTSLFSDLWFSTDSHPVSLTLISPTRYSLTSHLY